MYQEKIEAITNNITQLEKERVMLLREWAEKHHPLKIGERIMVNSASYAGKMIVIDYCFVDKRWEIWKWRALGKVVKRNGDVGTRRGGWSCPCLLYTSPSPRD